MTQDEHDAKCWRLLKLAVVESQSTMSPDASALAVQMLQLLMIDEVRVERANATPT